MDQNVINKIDYELFTNHNVVIGPNEGYIYIDGVAKFGTKVGPDHSIEDGLMHEIAHAAEVDNLRRIKCHGFNLKIKTEIKVLGESYCEPITWNATKLECRVILWQEILCQHFKLQFNRKDFALALKYMPDFWNVPMKGYTWDTLSSDYLDDKFKRPFKEKFEKREELRMQSIYDYMNEEKKTGKYTYKEFLVRWNKVLSFLEKEPLHDSFF